MKYSSAFELFAHCNHTELYQLCRRLKLPVEPATPREKMIGLLIGEEEPDTSVLNPIDSWRHGIMGFLLDHWQVVRAQLDCPAKSGDPRACFQCTDAQVISCLVDNPENEPLIQLRRKNEP